MKYSTSFLDLNYSPHMSSGSEQLVILFAKLYKTILELIEDSNFKKDKKLILILDEADIYLHANWQKGFIKILIEFLKNNFYDIKIHIIFTTHSPFLLSDIPKQNTIFLDTYDKEESEKKYPNLKFDNFKDGDCINATKEIDIKPFGANIHNLLAHGFFMEDGLMGEFAKSKINKIINFHKEVEENKKEKQQLLEKQKEITKLIESIEKKQEK